MIVPPLQQKPVLPARVRPIFLIGAGGVVRDAHLPAYRIAGFPVQGIFDLIPGRAAELAGKFGIPRTCASLAELVAAAPADAVFDCALPASQVKATLEQLPDRAAVLIQKPLGEDLAQAEAIREVCRRKGLLAAVNFQLRFAPFVLAARDAIARGLIGDVHDMEIRVTVNTPWHMWEFFAGMPRVEILYHSVHYVDVIRSFLGQPRGVYARSTRDPIAKASGLSSTCSSVLLDYGDNVRATVTANHGHAFGLKHQESYIKWEGSRGAIKARMGLLLDYPRGKPDMFELCVRDSAGAAGEWQEVRLEGSWFPHAFIGPMASLVRRANGESDELPTKIDDACRTMAVVEAAYASSQSGATPIPATD